MDDGRKPARTMGERPESAFARWSVALSRLLFNRADFWGAHEALEPAWRRAQPEQREALQGLIQAAATFHKLVVQDNRAGAQRLLARASAKLEAAPDPYLGLAMDSFCAELESWALRLREPGFRGWAGPIVGLPRLEWSGRPAPDRLSVDVVRLYDVVHGGRRAVLVALESDGLRGWGECRSGWGTFGLWDSLLGGVIPALLTEPMMAPSEARLLMGDVASDFSALSGVEFALWDLWSRRLGLTLGRAFGHEPRAVPLAGRVNSGDTRVVARELEEVAGRGYRRIIVPARPNADRRVVPALMAGLNVPCAIDLGGAYRPADYESLRVLDALHPACFVQPVAAPLLEHARRLRRRLEAPVSMGGWSDVGALENALELEACDLAHVDPAAMGPTGVLCAAEFARYRSIPLWLVSAAVTEVGARGDLALATHPAITEPCDLSRGAGEDDATAILPDDNGMAEPDAGAGIGYEPNSSWLDSVTVRRAELRA